MKFVKPLIWACLAWAGVGWIGSAPAHAQVPKSWSETSYAYEVNNGTLDRILRDFALSFGLQVHISGDFEQRVSAKYRATSVLDFLERLALEYRFQWFVFNGRLYISPMADHVVERIKVNQLSAGGLKKALSAVGLLDERFGWGELSGDGVVLVSGPKKYVEFVRTLVKGKFDDKDQSHVLTFKLRHAGVADRNIRYRDRYITIPGVATVLSQILSRKAKPVAKSEEAEQDSPQSQTKAAGIEAIGKFQSLLGGSPGNNMVTADVRNNLIFINDTPDKHERYQSIIDTLDVPLQLMEISAVIIDVNRDRLRELGINWLFADTAESVGSSALVVKRLGDFMMRLNALQSRGDVKVTARPSVMTQENHPAVIDLSQSVHQTATGERVAQFNKVTAGTSLQVIPRIVQYADGRAIQLVVDIEDGKLLPAINSDLVVQTSNISTQAVIKDGNALVLGGFTLERSANQTRQVPLLADIPILGELFANDSDGQSQQQRLFVLIPRLVANDEPSALPTRRTRLIAAPIDNKPIVEAFTQLVKGFIPAGFNQGEKPQQPICPNLADVLDFSQGQWLEGRGFKLAVGVVKASDGERLIEPSLCEGQGVLAVTFWPTLPLAKGQQGEVMIAYRSEQSVLMPNENTQQ